MKDLFDEIESRVKNPLFGYFLISFIAFNWEVIFFLFADVSSVSSRIDYFHEGTNYLTLIVYPLLTAAAYAVIYPWLLYLFMLFGIKPNELKNSLQVEAEHRLLTKKQELEDARAEILKNAEIELIDRAKRDVELSEIEDESIREKLKSEVEQLRKERDEIRTTLDKSKRAEQNELSPEEVDIIRQITKNGGTILREKIIGISSFDRVKTEYFLEILEDKGFLRMNYEAANNDYRYRLTTASKKLMVEKGVVN